MNKEQQELINTRERLWMHQKRSKKSYAAIAKECELGKDWLASFSVRPSESPLYPNVRRLQIYLDKMENK